MKRLKNILFGVLMLMIALPLLQRTVPVFDETPLKGSYSVPENPVATLAKVLDGSYQEAYNNYFEHTIGFRPLLVRINNQVAFSVFDTALANGVIIGKNNYLYEINYIKAFKGWDFVGSDVIKEHASKSLAVYNKLKHSGKTLIFVFAPGKASFFPDYIPDEYLNRPSGPATNYEEFKREFARNSLPVVDFNEWFVKMKDTATYPLYPQCGIHWSAYGAALATDSLIRYIERDQKIDMVDFGWNGFETPDTLRNPDYDIAEGMNLLWKIPHYKMAYPKVFFGDELNKIKPNALVVADSYYWNIFGKGYSSSIFADNNFWYYNAEAHNPTWPSPKKTADLDLQQELNKADVIIIMATEANLYRFPYGFIDRAYELLADENIIMNQSKIKADAEARKEAEIEKIMNSIDSNSEWKEKVLQKAREKKITYQEMLRLDAEWVYTNKNN